MPLAGYAAREEPCAGVHDDLFARALVLDNGERTLALVSVDLLAVSEAFTRRVRQSIHARTGIPPEAVMVAATHTHAAPVTISTFFNPGESLDRDYMDRLARAIEASVAEAWEQRAPARVGVGFGRVDGIGVNRRSPDRLPVDPEVGIIRVDDAAGRPVAVVVNYACHPTVLGPNNLLASGDFPAYTVARIEERLGPGSFAMFVNGTQGDISTGHSSELSAIGVITPGRTFERAEAFGAKLADAALAALPAVATTADVALAARIERLDLPRRPYPPAAETAAALDDARAALERAIGNAPPEAIAAARTRRLYASITHFYAGEAQAAANGCLPIELQAFRIGDVALVAVPAEVFVSIGLRVKAAAPRRTLIAGVTNGYIAYLPDRGAYASGGYEVVSAKCAEGSDDRLLDTIIEMEPRLFAK
jgi:neutral ceramidase